MKTIPFWKNIASSMENKTAESVRISQVDTPSESENRVSVRAGLHVKRYARHSLHLKIAGMLDRLYWVEAE